MEASKLLNQALAVRLERYNFPTEIKQGLAIDFASGGENIVTYYDQGEFDEYSLESLIGRSYDEIIAIFDCY